VPRPVLEVADIFRYHGAAWRDANRGHVSLEQLKVMSAIERCRTAACRTKGALTFHWRAFGATRLCCALRKRQLRPQYRRLLQLRDACLIARTNSCRNRHCPKCQGAAAREWLENRQAELLPVPYFHVVFTLPAAIADIAYHNKAVIYAILFKASSEAMLTIASDPKHLGAKIGVISVLHTWGSAMTHHPHVHMIVPGGGLAADGKSWIASRSNLLACARSDKHRATSSSPCACCRACCGACLAAANK
jgi:hypothetical protein